MKRNKSKTLFWLGNSAQGEIHVFLSTEEAVARQVRSRRSCLLHRGLGPQYHMLGSTVASQIIGLLRD